MEEARHALCRLAVVSGRTVAVDLRSDIDVGVAEPVAEEFQVDAGVERERGIRVANVVEPDPRDASSVGKPVEHPGDGLWVRCPAILNNKGDYVWTPTS